MKKSYALGSSVLGSSVLGLVALGLMNVSVWAQDSNEILKFDPLRLERFDRGDIIDLFEGAAKDTEFDASLLSTRVWIEAVYSTPELTNGNLQTGRFNYVSRANDGFFRTMEFKTLPIRDLDGVSVRGHDVDQMNVHRLVYERRWFRQDGETRLRYGDEREESDIQRWRFRQKSNFEPEDVRIENGSLRYLTSDNLSVARLNDSPQHPIVIHGETIVWDNECRVAKIQGQQVLVCSISGQLESTEQLRQWIDETKIAIEKLTEKLNQAEGNSRIKMSIYELQDSISRLTEKLDVMESIRYRIFIHKRW